MTYLKKDAMQKNLTPTAVVKELGISKANITNWRNVGNPSVEVLVKLADKLDCSIDYLLDVQKTPQRTKHLDQKKIDYIYSGKSMGILSQGYGFNFSDLTYLRKKLKISFAFMLTGIK